MRIDILTVVPELLVSPLNESILKRAQKAGLVEIVVHNIRDWATDKHRHVDDYPFGGEAGMVMKPEPVFRLISHLKSERHYDEIIFTSPDGVRYDQREANRLSTLGNIIILCGHYKGLDHRIREHLVTREISIGDYVLTGGELAAAVIADSVVRLLPGAIGDEESALTDSFQDGLLVQRLGGPGGAAFGARGPHRGVEGGAGDRAYAPVEARSARRNGRRRAMRYYLIAGEASGDLHGSNLMKGLLRNDPQAEFRFWGGDLMAAVGGRDRLAKHYRDASFFGIGEIVRRLPTVLSQIGECKRDIAAYAPDVLILIDYPGFNFRMAKFAHERGIRVFYYISPKVWAWKEHRVERIRRYVDKLFIIFPFEVAYFAGKGIDAVYEGNPLMDAVAERCAAMPPREEFLQANGLGGRPVIALLAGSRRSEVRNNLPFMTALAELMPEYDFVLAAVPWLGTELYAELLAGSRIVCLYDKTYEVVRYADAAVVTSGTATLETALIGTPAYSLK